MKNILLIFASIVILTSVGHQPKGGFKDPREESRTKSFHPRDSQPQTTRM